MPRVSSTQEVERAAAEAYGTRNVVDPSPPRDLEVWLAQTCTYSFSSMILETQSDTTDTHPEGMELRVLVPETNRGGGTYDGIDWGGERVADEVYQEIKKIEGEGRKVTKFSVTGFSLGGLVSRYVIGILHQRKFFETITPVNFNTVATPHIGLLRYRTFPSTVAAKLGSRLLSRTGEQIYGVDKWSASGLPLLEVMADPEHVFFKALSMFPHIRIYANAVNDMAVPHLTAAIELDDPFVNRKANGLILELDDKYPPLIKSQLLPSTLPPKPRIFSCAWFKSLHLHLPRPPLPAFLSQRFPLNILVYLALPILLPAFLIVFLARFLLAPCFSRSRIRVLEKDNSAGERLVHKFGDIESQMEDAMVNLVGGPRTGLEVARECIPPDGAGVLSTHNNAFAEAGPASQIGRKAPDSRVQSDAKAKPETTAKVKAKAKGTPAFSAGQYRMVTALNALPQLQKERAFIDGIGNSHDAIICRDVRHFGAHRAGAGVLRHWADHFVL
ncbi:hypothetical protein EVG20_g9119 [Dentipellis fragilis]|uniref:DUF676 domain-containing protein n=1 Tax=Dentipellis fragilis TaxID=205917 RepID=A0A4Y9Y0L3_9AGAM|nr:hypothetical protein EVG20_g9119 [Dentipellis fragilis]